MSERSDAERREERIAAKLETGKARLRFAQRVLTCWVDGLSAEATAERLGCSSSHVERLRMFLGLTETRGRGRVGRGRWREQEVS